MTPIEKLLQKTTSDIKQCKTYIKKAAKREDFEGAIRSQGMVDAFKKVEWDLKKIVTASTPPIQSKKPNQ